MPSWKYVGRVRSPPELGRLHEGEATPPVANRFKPPMKELAQPLDMELPITEAVAVLPPKLNRPLIPLPSAPARGPVMLARTVSRIRSEIMEFTMSENDSFPVEANATIASSMLEKALVVRFSKLCARLVASEKYSCVARYAPAHASREDSNLIISNSLLDIRHRYIHVSPCFSLFIQKNIECFSS